MLDQSPSVDTFFRDNVLPGATAHGSAATVRISPKADPVEVLFDGWLVHFAAFAAGSAELDAVLEVERHIMEMPAATMAGVAIQVAIKVHHWPRGVAPSVYEMVSRMSGTDPLATIRAVELFESQTAMRVGARSAA